MDDVHMTFRDANEKIRAKVDESHAPMERIPFLCECPDPDCTTIVRLTGFEYEGVRADGRHFLTAPGHEEMEKAAAQVVSHEDQYVVIEKVR
jgi:hypothetical protein